MLKGSALESNMAKPSWCLAVMTMYFMPADLARATMPLAVKAVGLQGGRGKGGKGGQNSLAREDWVGGGVAGSVGEGEAGWGVAVGPKEVWRRETLGWLRRLKDSATRSRWARPKGMMRRMRRSR